MSIEQCQFGNQYTDCMNDCQENHPGNAGCREDCATARTTCMNACEF